MKNLLFSLLMLAQGVSLPGNPTGVIEGRVLGMDGKPAAGIRVYAQAAPDSGAVAADASVMVTIVQSDAAGNFRLERIPPGRYYVTAGLVDFPTYYPGVTGIGNAKVLSVTAGAALSGIDFTMARPAGLKISGRALHKENWPTNATPRILLSGRNSPSQDVMPSQDGSFEFMNVPPGDYMIRISPANGSAPQQIVVNDKDVQVEIVVPRVFSVTGKLIVENDGARPRLILAFTDGGNRISAPLSSDGTYSVQLPAGNYRIAPNTLPAGFSMKSMVSGSTDLLKEPLKVTADASPQFVITLGVTSPPPWVRVTGHVEGGVPGDSISMTGTSAGETLQTKINPDGTIEFPKVLPGTYTARLNTGGAARSVPPFNLTVGNTDVDNWKIVLPATATISGRLTVEGAPPFQRPGPILTFSVTNTGSVAPNASARGAVTLSTAVGAGGSFNLTLPEGSQQLSLTTLPAGYVVKSMTYGAVNLLTSPLVVDSKDFSKALNLNLEPSPTAKWFSVSVRPSGEVQGSEIDRVTLLGNGTGTVEGQYSSAGAYEFSRVAPGSYTARALALVRGIDVSVPVVVTSKDVTDVEVRFPKQKQTSGHITLESGGAFRPRFWLTLTGANTVTIYITDQADGSFIARLPEGEWRVSVGGLPTELTLKSFTYGDTDLTRNSVKVTAADTQELRMILAPSASSSLVKVSGRFIPPKLEGPLAAQFSATITKVTLMGPATIETPLNPDGTFEFKSIPPGTYSWCCNFGFASIMIPKNDVSDLIIRSITGRVIQEKGEQQSGVYVNAEIGGRTSAASVGRDGSFVLIVPEGSYRLSMSAIPAGYYLKSIRYGGAEVANQTLNLPAGQDTLELQLLIAPRP